MTTHAPDDVFRPVIRRQLDSLGLNVSAAAREAELGRTELSLYLNGHRGIRLDKLGRLLEALNIDVRPRAPRRRRSQTG